MKKILTLALALALCAGLQVTAGAANVQLSDQNLEVNSVKVECEKYNIDGSNYFKLRDLAYLLDGSTRQFNVTYDAEARTVSVTTGQAYVADGSELVIGEDKSATARESSQTILVDGEEITGISVYNIGGNNYFKLRDLGNVLDLVVDYNDDTRTAIVESGDSYTVDYTYNEAGLVASETFTYVSGDVTVYTYEYDSHGNQTKMTSGDGAYTMTTAWTYDAAGKPLTEASSDTTGDAWTWTYTYDAAGNCLVEAYDDGTVQESYTYTYDKNGNQITEVFDSPQDICYKSEYAYDENGNLLVDTTTWETGEITVYTYEYDAHNGCVKYAESTDGEPSHGYTQEITYNESGKPASRTISYTDEEGSGTYSISYEYNEAGQRTRMTVVL